jgi:D-serine deaminase-like pyridoxal phosphate-dependent protein
MNITDLPTPSLLIDSDKMAQNVARLSARIKQLGCKLRPHVKTHKSVLIADMIKDAGNTQGITVSTIKEAEHFFSAGYEDILYAVGIVPNKFSQIHDLMKRGCDIKVILDNEDTVALLAEYAKTMQCPFKILIELDVDSHRAGVKPKSESLLDIARAINKAKYLSLQGVMTHAGGSYDCFDLASQLAIAKQERDLSLLAAKRIRDHGITCNVVSIGSTPTAFAVDHLEGITEVRAGVYVLFDLVMAGLGVCNIDDIAISVLSSVIGFQKEKNWVLADAGWMAMSRDKGTSNHKIDQAYGVICDIDGQVQRNQLLVSANQEHGIIGMRDQQDALDVSQYGIGDFIRILPNHACATAAQYEHYYLLCGQDVIAKVESIQGW